MKALDYIMDKKLNFGQTVTPFLDKNSLRSLNIIAQNITHKLLNVSSQRSTKLK